MALVDSLMQLRRTVHEANMEDENMPEVVLLFPNHSAKDVFSEAVHREMRNVAPHMMFNGERIQIAGIHLTIGVR